MLPLVSPVTRWLTVTAVAGLLVACVSTSQPTPTLTPSLAASPSPATAGNLPPGCEPINLRAPSSGERVELDGAWTEVGTAGQLLSWWIRTQGDCVWGSGHIEGVPPAGTIEARPDQVQSLSGKIGSDFVIAGEILFLGPIPFAAPGSVTPYSPLRMLIEWDAEGEILLREDREPAAVGPRCPDPAGFCPPPLVLRPAE
jgi:hypothetical protein